MIFANAATSLRAASCGMVIAVLSCLLGAVGEARASCGDHLVGSSGHVSIGRGDDMERPNRLPVRCHGPQCRRQAEIPVTPTVPPAQPVTRELFIQSDHVVLVFGSGLVLPMGELRCAGSICWGRRLERPPQIGALHFFVVG